MREKTRSTKPGSQHASQKNWIQYMKEDIIEELKHIHFPESPHIHIFRMKCVPQKLSRMKKDTYANTSV